MGLIISTKRTNRQDVNAITENRNINATQNILTKDAKAATRPWLRPDAPQGEAMKQLKDAKQIAVSAI